MNKLTVKDLEEIVTKAVSQVKPKFKNLADYTKTALEKQLQIRGWIEGERMILQASMNDLIERKIEDSQAAANLDVAQQVLTKIEEVNNR